MAPPAARPPPWPPWRDQRRRRRAALAVAALAAAAAAALFARSGAREDLALGAQAAVAVAWFAAVTAAVRRPPRPRAPRVAGVPELRAAAVRRYGPALALLPVAALVAARLFTNRDDPAALAALGVAGFGAMAWLVTRPGRAFRIAPAGLELVARGRPFGLVRWDALREVRVETWRSHAGLVLLSDEGAPSAGVSAWLEGAPELAAALLERAPAEALAGEGVREKLHALAAELHGAG